MPFLNLKFTIQKPLICWNCHDLKCHLLNASQMYDAKLLVRLQSIFSQEKKKKPFPNMFSYIFLTFTWGAIWNVSFICTLWSINEALIFFSKLNMLLLWPHNSLSFRHHCVYDFSDKGHALLLSYFLTGLFITLTLWPLPSKS